MQTRPQIYFKKNHLPLIAKRCAEVEVRDFFCQGMSNGQTDYFHFSSALMVITSILTFMLHLVFDCSRNDTNITKYHLNVTQTANS